MSIPMNFYTWWLVIAIGCPAFVLLANIGMRGTNLDGISLTAKQQRLMVIVGALMAILFPIVFVSENRGAIQYEFGKVNVLPLMYLSVGVVLVALIALTKSDQDVLIQKQPWILISERKRMM